MTEHSYSIRSTWWGDRSSPAEIGDRFLDSLDRLTPLDRAMADWLLMERSPTIGEAPLAAVRSRMAKMVEDGVQEDDEGVGQPDEGYDVFACSGAVLGSASELATSGGFELGVTAGSQYRNHVTFETVPDRPGDPALSTYPIYRGALDVLASAWPLPWAFTQLFVPKFPPLKPIIPPIDFAALARPKPPLPKMTFMWMLYLSAPLAEGLTPPSDLACEPTPGGGMVLSAAQTRLDPDDRDGIRRALRLEAIFDHCVGDDAHMRGQGPAARPRVGPY